MKIEDLKPCPFCGSDKLRVHAFDGCTEYLAIVCTVCDASGPLTDDEEEVAVKSWNKRAVALGLEVV